MKLDNAYIPYGAYWSTPFSKWQGMLAEEHSLALAASCGRRFLDYKKLAPSSFDGFALGVTVPQRQGFYGAPWVAAMMGAAHLDGPTVSQACATSVATLAHAARSVELGERRTFLAVTCDRTSNGPHVYYPSRSGPGGKGAAEDPVLDNMGHDPHARVSMTQTAENVARAAGSTLAEQHEVTLLRHAQYQRALEGDRAFQRRYLLPVEGKAGKKPWRLEIDEGVHPATREGLAALKPVIEGGTVTYGSQTHPADGNAGIVVTTGERARELSRDAKIAVRLVSFGAARVAAGFMPQAPVPAARQALERAGLSFAELKAVKTHNPFAVNDLYFAKETGFALERMNQFGCSLVYGHPQGPTGMRGVIEVVEELVLGGGGYGLFTGCAAGDTAMAVVLKVG
ncbi:MAG: thiolase family protein [Deltaproteobacteria bacterium]|nr:thiolase family protein [Deltaproteobacteria bacterium]